MNVRIMGVQMLYYGTDIHQILLYYGIPEGEEGWGPISFNTWYNKNMFEDATTKSLCFLSFFDLHILITPLVS
jgi:hypothetical protein